MPTPAPRTFGDLALPGAPVVARLFLPLVDGSDDSAVPASSTWQALAEEVGLELTGSTSWVELAGWGTGQGEPTTRWRPVHARAPAATLDAVVGLLLGIGGRADGWVLTSHPELAGPVTAREISIGTFADRWRDGPVPGDLRLGSTVSVAGPAHADSLVISGPAALVELAGALGLELRRVARRTSLPTLTW